MERSYRDLICTIYDYFYNKIYKTDFHLDLTINNQGKQVDNFIARMAKHYPQASIGGLFLIDYFCFAFAQWHDRNTQRRISLNWIIGKKMIALWLERSSEQLYYVRKFLKEYDINLDVIKYKITPQPTSTTLSASEELEKQRFSGYARLHNCIAHTTLFHHLSTHCIACEVKSDCKKVLHSTNLSLYKKRGY